MMCLKSHSPLHVEKIQFKKKNIFSLSSFMTGTIPVENSSLLMCILYAYIHVSQFTEKQCYLRSVC